MQLLHRHSFVLVGLGPNLTVRISFWQVFVVIRFLSCFSRLYQLLPEKFKQHTHHKSTPIFGAYFRLVCHRLYDRWHFYII